MSTPSASAMNGRRTVMRWSVAAVATATLVVSGSGLVAFAQSGDGGSQGPEFVPADAAAYVEARLQMPGGQHDAVAQMMTAFPGFADPGSFDMKVDEAIAMVAAQTGMDLPEGDLIGDVFTGEVGIAIGDLEAAMMGADPTVIIGMAAADADAVGSVMEELVVTGGTEMTVTTYNETLVLTDDTSSPPMSMALHGDWMLIGTGEETVHGAIDALDGTAPSLADDPDFVTSWSRLPAARLGGAWMDFSSFGSLIDMGAMMAEGETGMALPMDELMSMMPQDMVASLVAENDRVTLEALISCAEQSPDVLVGTSVLPMSFPSETQVYIETRELGMTVENALTQVVDMMAAQDAMAADGAMGSMGEIEMLIGEDSPITAMLGVPLPEFLDFVGDAGVGAGLSSDGLWAGIAGEIIDDAAAQERVTSLMTILRMALLGAEEEGVSIDTAPVAGVEVTTITLPISETMAQSGLPLAMGDTIDVAIHGDTLLIGMGDFVTSAILSDGSDSLGTSAGFLDALGEDTVNSGVMYMNISSLLDAVDPLLSMMSPEWAEISPYATGLDRMIAVGTADDEVIRSRMTVIVGQ